MGKYTINLDRDKTIAVRYTRLLHHLTVQADADGEAVAIEISGDVSGTTPIEENLHPGSYEITYPDQIIVDGATYSFSRVEEV